jgi:hypothetical protein
MISDSVASNSASDSVAGCAITGGVMASDSASDSMAGCAITGGVMISDSVAPDSLAVCAITGGVMISDSATVCAITGGDSVATDSAAVRVGRACEALRFLLFAPQFVFFEIYLIGSGLTIIVYFPII